MSTRLPVLVGLAELVELFPSYKKQTIYHWRIPERQGMPGALPPEEVNVSGRPIWLLDEILVWAARTSRPVSAAAVARIRAEQSSPPASRPAAKAG